MISSVADKNNDRINHRMMNRFRRLISDLALQDIYLHGRHYTWSNKQMNPTLVKNDRVLCTTSWDVLLPQCLLCCLASTASDHCLLFMECSSLTPIKRHFHFDRLCTKLDGFQQLVAEAWNSVAADSNPFRTLYFRFKATAHRLQG